MGFVSFIAQDTKRSIPNVHNSFRMPFTVTMIDDKGNHWKEENYDGYGDSGGKDFFVLVDEMNGGTGDRSRGIELYYQKGKGHIFPNLVEHPEKWRYVPQKPQKCPFQGFFYGHNQ